MRCGRVNKEVKEVEEVEEVEEKASLVMTHTFCDIRVPP